MEGATGDLLIWCAGTLSSWCPWSIALHSVGEVALAAKRLRELPGTRGPKRSVPMFMAILACLDHGRGSEPATCMSAGGQHCMSSGRVYQIFSSRWFWFFHTQPPRPLNGMGGQ